MRYTGLNCLNYTLLLIQTDKYFFRSIANLIIILAQIEYQHSSSFDFQITYKIWSSNQLKAVVVNIDVTGL